MKLKGFDGLAEALNRRVVDEKPRRNDTNPDMRAIMAANYAHRFEKTRSRKEPSRQDLCAEVPSRSFRKAKRPRKAKETSGGLYHPGLQPTLTAHLRRFYGK